VGIFDKAKEALSEHSEHVDSGIERAGDLIDEKTGGKYADKVDQGQGVAGDKLRDYLAKDTEKPV
jgi:hypothetical protein